MQKQDVLLIAVALLLGTVVVQLGAFGTFPAPALNVRIVGQAADLRVVDVAASSTRLADERAKQSKQLEERVRGEFAALRSSVEASLPRYLVLELDKPPSSTAIAEELQIMSDSGYSLVAVLPIVGSESPHESLARLSGPGGSRDRPTETRTVGVILIGKRDRN